MRFGQSKSAPQQRAVFVISWGRTATSSSSFHKCLLVANEADETVSLTTTGTYFDWGSIVDKQKVTKNNPPRVRPFDFEKGEKFAPSYVFKGMTVWSDRKIGKFMTKIGSHYDVVYNNCRDVTEMTAATVLGQHDEDKIEEKIKNYRIWPSVLAAATMPFSPGYRVPS
ncbi:hypothetical protein ACHAPV_009609 [Trichoderma viride]